jgi:hypothetical protein
MRKQLSHIEKKYCGAAAAIFTMRNHSFVCEKRKQKPAP